MTISSRPDQASWPGADGARVFAAPWEAKAFALVVALHQRGVFPWRAFHEALAVEVARDAGRADPDGQSALYYKQWVAAAVAVLDRLGLVDDATIKARQRDIAATLAAGDHDHAANPDPVAIARARP
jgi:nitrile hydratase accessory protein